MLPTPSNSNDNDTINRSPASAVRERFHQVYQTLVGSGVPSNDAAAQALLVVSGQAHTTGVETRGTAQEAIGESSGKSTSDSAPQTAAVDDDGADEARNPSHQGSSMSTIAEKAAPTPTPGQHENPTTGGTGTAQSTEGRLRDKGQMVQKKQEEPGEVEMITAKRISELIEIGHASGENFRELIRFLGRTLSDPHCVDVSFALPSSGGGGARHAQGRSSAQDAPVAADDVPRRETAVLDSSPPYDAMDVETAAVPVRASTGTSTSGAKSPNSSNSCSSRDLVSATPSSSMPVEQAHQGFSFKPTSRIMIPNPTDDAMVTDAEEKGGDGQGYSEWIDRSAVGVDVKAATEVWRVLRELDVEGVSGAVLNALESLTQALLTKVLDRGSSAAAGGRSGTVAEAGGGVASDGGGAPRADLRSLVLILEHPEVQDPDFEGVLCSLFKLSTGLTENRGIDLVEFLAGLEESRYSRYLGAVQQFISLRLYSGGDASSVLPAVQFVHQLYIANQQSRKVDDEAFYNEAVNLELFSHRTSLIEDYGRWREDQGETNRARYKSLISFGEVLDPASKAAVLSVDSQMQMRGMIDSELQEAMMSGNLADGGLTVMPYLLLRVRRSNIVEDSLHALVMLADDDLKKPLRVQFVGEEGVDEGGVQKEYFQVMLRELLDPQYAMLKYDEETRSLWFNSDSLEAQEEFELVGMLLGIAIYNGIILDVRFPSVVYKLLMGEKPTLQDLKEAQPSLGRGLQQLLDFDGDVQETFDRTFQISYEVFGAIKTFDLKEDGGNEAVTRYNRQEYVDLYVQWLLVKSVKEQYGPFERGFHKVVGGKALKLFRPAELELLICGNPQLDFLALEENSKYEDGYKRETPVIQNFWEVVHAFDEDSKRKLLKFATGSDRVPIGGLGSSGMSLVISRNGDDSDRLPTAHTCFNHLLLPSYSSKEKLEDRLRVAIEQSEGFGLR